MFSRIAPNLMASQICGSFSFAQVDALGIAAAFEVEHTLIAPAMLIITDESTVRIGAQGGLTRYR